MSKNKVIFPKPQTILALSGISLNYSFLQMLNLANGHFSQLKY